MPGCNPGLQQLEDAHLGKLVRLILASWRIVTIHRVVIDGELASDCSEEFSVSTGDGVHAGGKHLNRKTLVDALEAILGTTPTPMTARRCSRCQQFKPIQQFAKNRTITWGNNGRGGYSYLCKQCDSLRKRRTRSGRAAA